MNKNPFKKVGLLLLAAPLLSCCGGERADDVPSSLNPPSSDAASDASSAQTPVSSDDPSPVSSETTPIIDSGNGSSSSSSSSSSSVSDPEPYEFQTVGGSFDYRDYGATSKSAAAAIITNARFKNGTVKMKVMANGTQAAGFLFRSDAMMSSYYSLHLESYNGNQLVLTRHENGSSSTLGSCYITAGYTKTADVELKVIVTDGKIQCFFEDKLFISRVDSTPLSGAYVGISTSNVGTVYENMLISKKSDFKTVDTLVTGHSYMELWSNYKQDLSRYPDIFNIGIGGTSSPDWAGHVEEVVDYHPNRLIYMIGINDVGWKTAAAKYLQNVKNYIDPLLTRLPDLQVALVSVNNCPQYQEDQALIDSMNALLKNYVAKTDRVFYADVDDAFLKSDGTPDPDCFVDGLHPTASSYLTIRDAIYDAFDGKNQPEESEESEPTFDEDSGKALVNEIKAASTSSDWSFSENKITMNSTGFNLSSKSYSDFSVALDFTGLSTSKDNNDNPFFSHKATKGFLFGGSVDSSGNYQGYILNVSYDWFEILKLSGYTATFVDGFNIEPEGTKARLTLQGTTCSLAYADGTSMGTSFNKKNQVTLSDYAGGKVGTMRNDSFASVATIYEFK